MAMFGSTGRETYEVRLPDGRVVRREAPAGASDADVRSLFADAMRGNGINALQQQVLRPPVQQNALAQTPPAPQPQPNALANEQHWRAQLGDQGSLSAYSPPPTERIGNAAGGMFGRNTGGALTRFLRDWTPLGNLDGITHGNNTDRQLSMLPLPGPARKAAARAAGHLEEFMRDGSDRFLMYTSPEGRVANIHLKLGPDGTAEISVDPFMKEANRFGPAEVRAAAMEMRKLYPEITAFTGERLSGARPGRQQTVSMTGKGPR